ncbi:cobaltochelatase CobT-related protein [Klebsiella pneumoniae]|uniref:cobaltochelatase CobT-related protein n=1 Tax=Klebsiella pneumoniae TaxID=573 RepID=UPI000E2E37EE|nr:VWA domain-containing protein [Klebsiella pneumoniae]SVP40474.1 porphyrin biosynthetic protein [Klebsiella pneumoniae]
MATAQQVSIFRDAIKKVTTILAGKDLPVIERGRKAYVRYHNDEPVEICIPSIPDDASEKFMEAIRGFVDHEVAHILFTDNKAITAATGGKKIKAFFILNAVEDVFIEKKMSKLFAGSNANLIATRRHVIEDVFTPRLRDALAQSADEVQLFRNFFLVPALRSWGGQLDFISFMEEHGKHVGEVCAFLEGKGIRADIENLDKSLDSLALAGKITKWLNEFSDLKEKDEPEKEKSEAKEKPEESEEEAEEDQPDEEVEDADEGDEEVGEDEDEDESEAEDADEDADEAEEGDEAEESDEAEDAGDDADEAEEDDLPSLIDALMKAESSDGDDLSIEKALNEIMGIEEVMSTEDKSYRPFERTSDYMGPLEDADAFMRKVFGDPENSRLYVAPYGVEGYKIEDDERCLRTFSRIGKKMDAGDDTAAAIAKDLERAIASKNRTMFIPGQKKGKVHGPSLYRLNMNDDRVFRQKDEKRAVNACVQLAIDMSGSMSGERIHMAAMAAYTMAKALDAIKVPCIVTGFTTGTMPRGSWHNESTSRPFTRFESLFLPILKGWNRKADSLETRRNLGHVMKGVPLLNNVDGESIRSLSRHFNDRKEDRKIMIVLSDGEPHAVGRGFANDLRKAVGDIEQTGIDLYGVGIQTTAPKRFYTKSVVIHNLPDLGKELIRLIAGSLIE